MTQPRQPFTDEMAAYAAAAWASGTPQKELAKQYGYSRSVSVCVAIRAFLLKYHPDAARWSVRYRHGEAFVNVPYEGERRALVPTALQAFMQVRAAGGRMFSQSNRPA